MVEKPHNPSLQYVTLLDLFAAAWLAGVMANDFEGEPTAYAAYAKAHEMLAEREKWVK